jgi:hypothetical protein
MDLKAGDWVKTADGDSGKVIHTSQMTVFVAFPREGKTDFIGAFLASQLTKIEPPELNTATD